MDRETTGNTVTILDVDVTQSMVTLPGPWPQTDMAVVHDLIDMFNIRSVPTLVVINELGEEVQTRWTGQATPKEYEDWLLSWKAT